MATAALQGALHCFKTTGTNYKVRLRDQLQSTIISVTSLHCLRVGFHTNFLGVKEKKNYKLHNNLKSITDDGLMQAILLVDVHQAGLLASFECL